MGKFGFEQCIIYGSEHSNGATPTNAKWPPEDQDPAAVECSSSSSISKACRIRFTASGPDDSVEVDVLDLKKETWIVDRRGRTLIGSAAVPRRRLTSGPFNLLVSLVA